jgi:uncharacterized protein (DUF2267 family)
VPETRERSRKEQHLAVFRFSSAGGGADAAHRSVSDARREAESAITAQLPEKIQPALRPKAEEAKGFVGRVTRRVAEREGVDIETARIDASAVMRVLSEAVTPGVLDDVMTRLPNEFNTLLRQ